MIQSIAKKGSFLTWRAAYKQQLLRPELLTAPTQEQDEMMIDSLVCLLKPGPNSKTRAQNMLAYT